MKQPDPKSNDGSKAPDWLKLDLPVAPPDGGPVPHPEPTWEQIEAHAAALRRSLPADYWEHRRAMMNPRRFIMH